MFQEDDIRTCSVNNIRMLFISKYECSIYEIRTFTCTKYGRGIVRCTDVDNYSVRICDYTLYGRQSYHIRIWFVHHTDVHDTKYGSHFFQNTDMICNVVRMSLVQYTDVHKLRISTIYGRRQYTDVYNIRTLTIYGRSASPYIVNVRILSTSETQVHIL